MRAQALGLSLVVLCGCTAVVAPSADEPGAARKSVASDTTLEGVKVTRYTLVSEAETSGSRTGDASTLCHQNGLSGCYHKEFLCSGYGVAMQGTGRADNGKYIQYVSGGGGWNSNHTWLNNCGGAHFAETDGVRGSSGRSLVERFSIATDTSLIPSGWFVWVDSEGQWFRADDTGGAIDGRHVDIYVGTDRSDANQTNTTRVYVTATTHQASDPSPFDGSSGGSPADNSAPTDGCNGLSFTGACQGSVLRWCENGVLRTADCASDGRTCGWTDDSVGYDCLGSAGPAAGCGNGVCDAGETASSCPADCGGSVAPVCGDGRCDAGETAAACPADCGSSAAPLCGDGRCDAGETAAACPADCGSSAAPVCGDGRCDPGETAAACPADCGSSAAPVCGDGWCDPGETATSCAADCGGSGGCWVASQFASGANGDPCAEPPETWRCAWIASYVTYGSQVCRDGEWVTYHLNPADCAACCGDYSSACS
jgi:3D (Asp-Asp-Asp) domain-containing protein